MRLTEEGRSLTDTVTARVGERVSRLLSGLAPRDRARLASLAVAATRARPSGGSGQEG